MKNNIVKKIGPFGYSIVLFVMVSAVLSAPEGESGDPILSFYCRRAAETYVSRDPLESGLTFSFRARTHYINIDEHGEVARLDSGIIDYYYSFGELDSSHVILAPQRSQKPVDFSVTNVFADAYDFFFYPNDTGGADLAIGFDTFRPEDTLPVGLAIIDRDFYYLRWLHLHYPHKKYHKRFSQSFRFLEHQGYIFADSVWQVSAKRGVFMTDFFRTETVISDIMIYR